MAFKKNFCDQSSSKFDITKEMAYISPNDKMNVKRKIVVDVIGETLENTDVDVVSQHY